MGKGDPFNRRPATLVLRDVAITPDQVPDTITPFIAPSVPDPDAILIEATVSSPAIPDVDLLLHADCNEQEVTCEISHYYPHIPSDDDDDRVARTHFFIATVDLEGGGLSTTLVLQTLEVQRDPDPGGQAPVEGRLGMPLSQSGSLLTEVVFLVFSNEKTLLAPLGSDALLHCGFRQREMGQEVGQEMGVEWWFQHQGRGVKVVDLKMSTHSQEHSEAVNFKREGSSVDAALLVADGDASMTLQKVKVSDEGTYICTVHVGTFQAQQAVKLHAYKPPRVSLSEDKLVSQEFPHKLSCHCQNYYPMDAKMEWFSVSPDDAETTDLSGQISLSGHRQHSDGTLSMSSYLYLEQGSFPPGTTLTCRVTHQALAAPINTSLVVQEPTPVPTDSYWMVLGFLLITVMFFYQLMK
ncbi:Tapasin-related protein [Merluccius polli]|uniref:Tapasin-related protein n=1 Tax=Merluccius polli TaxID=89951 RepID=A0AA47N125_MERPO|nr:Tapasin-related protein [Merluccius polli]